MRVATGITIALLAAVLALTVSVSAQSSSPKWGMKIQHFASIAMAIDCDTPTNCMCPTVNTNNGTDILFSNDQGNTWTQAGEPLEMMLLGGAISGKTAAASSPFNMIASYSGNLYNWTTLPKGYPWVQSQNVEPFGLSGECFGAVGGAELDKNPNSWGTCVSCDHGASWWFSNASHVITCWTRYGAYPTPTTWYISSGNWPENSEERAARMRPDSNVHAISARLHINKATGQDEDGVPRMEFKFAADRTPEQNIEIMNSGNGYLAQLLKTTDGGKTWVSQFESSGFFYFNQIGCPSENHCCAVGEADTDSKQAGIQIWCTWNGGSTWTQTYRGSDPTLSALSLQFLSENHVFVGGASLRQQLIMGIFWESVDGGKTWTESFVKDAYPAEMTFGSESFGLATGFDLEGDSCLLSYE